LIGITVLAGTQEATRQFDGLKSSLKNFTRASLWSGLIVYAQPVNDGKLPTPQIYYLMPPPQQRQPAAPAAEQPLLADNSNGATTTKPAARNNHGEEAAEALSNAEASNAEAHALAAMREFEDIAKSELILNKLPLNLIAAHRAAPKPDRVRVYEEVAKHEPLAARRLRQEADEIAKAFAKEVDGAKLIAETGRLVAEQAVFERLKSKTLGEMETLHRRIELRAVRRPVPRPERPERIRALVPSAGKRGVTLPEISTIGCEKLRTKPEAAPSVAKTTAQLTGEPVAESGLPDAPHPAGKTWTLNCDTEPEQQQ
jgi:hypothetical protein